MESKNTDTDLHAAVMAALASVDDPEMGENLVDLGVVGEVLIEGDSVRVSLIPTSATCPMADVMIDDALTAVQRACPPGIDVDVHMDWDTEWSPERLAPELRARFGW
ncbi:metal-sulfur cluster assembly factor [Hydrogenophaga sp. MI9]|uniref:metal-sulfur cluster assembly factor n=1 Tax=Hydrogenophaga sp. MI9 TaxID=3453719 RepID=UPI003EEFDA26